MKTILYGPDTPAKRELLRSLDSGIDSSEAPDPSEIASYDTVVYLCDPGSGRDATARDLRTAESACLRPEREFISLDGDPSYHLPFMEMLLDGRIPRSVDHALRTARRILDSADSGLIVMSDCDGTLSVTDLTSTIDIPEGLMDYDVFSGGYYTSFQYWRAYGPLADLPDLEERMLRTSRNLVPARAVLDDLAGIDAFRVGITAGLEGTWAHAVEGFGSIDMVVGSDPFGHGYMTAGAKAFTARHLKESGRRVVALGDSMIDAHMLLEADRPYAICNGRMNPRFSTEARRIPGIRQPSYNAVLYDSVPVIGSIRSDIADPRFREESFFRSDDTELRFMAYRRIQDQASSAEIRGNGVKPWKSRNRTVQVKLIILFIQEFLFYYVKSRI